MIERLRSRLGVPFRRWAPALLLVVAVVGVAVLPFLPARAQPIRWRPDPELRELVFTERASVAVRFGLYEDLRTALRGGVLVVPPDSVVFAYIARALAEVTVETRDYEPSVDPASLPEPAFAGTHDGSGEVVTYMILPGSGDLWWLALDGDTVVIVPAELIPVPETADG